MQYAKTTKIPQEQYPIRVYQLLKEQGFNPDIIHYIHIAGSKGKGSLAKTCFQILKENGNRVGLFTSPHIFDIRERLITQNGMITEQDLLSLIQRYTPIFEIQALYFFEICLFLGIIYFLEQKCTIVVLEVGVGGRYDPTNFCMPILSLLGHISLEHKDFLGNTIQKIAYDKAGIIKKNIPAFSTNQEKSVKKIFLQEGKVQFFDELITIENFQILDNFSASFDLIINLEQKIIINNIILNRIGQANLQNFALAIAGMYKIYPNISPQIIQKVALQKIAYRMDLIAQNVLIDTAHNGASFENLMKTTAEWLHWHDICLYLTLLEGKEAQDIIDVLKKYRILIKEIYVFDFEYTKKSQGKNLFNDLKEDFSVVYMPNLEIKEIISHQKYIFAGSFYSIPLINSLLKNEI